MGILEEKKTEIILGLTVLFGFIFRLINVYTKVLLGDPPHLALQAVNFLDSGLLIIWDQSAYLWYAFTDIFYDIFGITQFASRFSSLLFGTLSILAIYLFTLEFSKNKRMALFSAIIFAFAPVFIWHAADEHDISVLFFIIMTFYTLIHGLKNNSRPYLIISAVLFGLSCMWKAYVPILIIPYLGMIFYYGKIGKYETKKNYKLIILLMALIFLLVTPNIVYNYSNYKHNKVVDFLYATQFTFLKNEKMEQLYGWTGGAEIKTDKGFFYRLFVDGNPENPDFNDSNLFSGLTISLYSNGHLLSLVALLSLLYIYINRKEEFCKEYGIFYLLYFIVPFIILVNGNVLNKHYVHFFAFALPIISYTIDSLINRAAKKYPSIEKLNTSKNFPYFAFILIVLYVFFITLSLTSSLTGSFFSRNPEGILMNYKSEQISEDSLIVYDDRIYNSEAGWLFGDRPFIPVSFFNQFQSYNEQSKLKRPTDVYFIECVVDDCGWGTVWKNPQLNSSMESFFELVNNQSVPLVYSTKSKLGNVGYDNPLFRDKDPRGETFRVYKTTLNIDINLAKSVKKQYSYFLYPINYEDKQNEVFRNFIYTPSGTIEIFLNKLAWIVFYANILLSFCAIIFLFYEVYLRY